MRSKEEAHDYRYFPEPDLPPLHVARARDRGAAARRCRSCRRPKRERFMSEYGLPEDDAEPLRPNAPLAAFFEDRRARASDDPKPRPTGSWASSRRPATTTGLAPRRLAGSRRSALAELLGPRRRRARWSASGKDVFAALVGTGKAAGRHRRAKGLGADRATQARWGRWSTRCIATNPGEAAKYRAGKKPLLGFFVGQVMKRSGGRAEPKAVQQLLRAQARLVGADTRHWQSALPRAAGPLRCAPCPPRPQGAAADARPDARSARRRRRHGAAAAPPPHARVQGPVRVRARAPEARLPHRARRHAVHRRRAPAPSSPPTPTSSRRATACWSSAPATSASAGSRWRRPTARRSRPCAGRGASGPTPTRSPRS